MKKKLHPITILGIIFLVLSVVIPIWVGIANAVCLRGGEYCLFTGFLSVIVNVLGVVGFIVGAILVAIGTSLKPKKK